MESALTGKPPGEKPSIESWQRPNLYEKVTGLGGIDIYNIFKKI